MPDYYTVKYKLPGDLFWRKIRKVNGDGIVARILDKGDPVSLPEPYRFFTTVDGGMIHLPFQAMVRFGPEREAMIYKDINKTVAGGR